MSSNNCYSPEGIPANCAHFSCLNLSVTAITDDGVLSPCDGLTQRTLVEFHISSCLNLTDRAVMTWRNATLPLLSGYFCFTVAPKWSRPRSREQFIRNVISFPECSSVAVIGHILICILAKLIGQSLVTAIAVRTNEMRKPCLL